ncbi:hypothetical protein [Phascolarctobacterium sp.]|uniref:hypothetical protein n=1 Tax=Phascolarctobacterium sp. TaxID=2049039 RepID=UPI00386CA74A
MKPFELQELEQCGFFSKMFGSKPAENGWKALNNLLAEASDATTITADQVHSALKQWGVKFSEENMQQRSGLYRKLADVVFTEAQTKDDPLFAQTAHLAELLELPPHLVKLADKGAKTAAYFIRCRNLLTKEEKLDIHAINDLFGYDYEDGLSIRKQVFQAHFNLLFEDIVKEARYSPDQEAAFRADCATLDIPYEFKNNIVNALHKYRDLWAAENQELHVVETDLPLEKGEVCRAYVNCGLCQHKVIEREDNLFELTRKFEIDETVNFKGEKLEHPKIKEEATVLLELGHFFLTNQRILYFSEKNAFGTKLQDLSCAEFDGINIVTFHRPGKDDILLKFPDEAAEVIYILFNRVKKEEAK